MIGLSVTKDVESGRLALLGRLCLSEHCLALVLGISRKCMSRDATLGPDAENSSSLQ